MKCNFYILFFIFLFFIFGGTLFLINREFLIVKWSWGGFSEIEDLENTKKNLILRKNVNLYYYKDEKFYTEAINTVWFTSKPENLKHLINNWLSFLHDERILNKKVYLESASLSESGQELFLSFDQIPFIRDWSIFNKLCLIESLLKTINKVNLGIQKVVFLVDHQVMEDDHLDFSQGWPVDGFLEEGL